MKTVEAEVERSDRCAYRDLHGARCCSTAGSGDRCPGIDRVDAIGKVAVYNTTLAATAKAEAAGQSALRNLSQASEDRAGGCGRPYHTDQCRRRQSVPSTRLAHVSVRFVSQPQDARRAARPRVADSGLRHQRLPARPAAPMVPGAFAVIALSDKQLKTVMAAASLVPIEKRSQFLERIAAMLSWRPWTFQRRRCRRSYCARAARADARNRGVSAKSVRETAIAEIFHNAVRCVVRPAGNERTGGFPIEPFFGNPEALTGRQ